MKKRRNIIILLIIICLLLIRCNVNKSDTEKQEEEGNKITSKVDDEIVWAVPNFANSLVDNQELVNQALEDKGFNYHVEYLFIDTENYNEELESLIKDGKVDIAFYGIENPKKLVDKGLFENLDNWIETDTPLYNCFPEEYWETVKYNGNTYMIPNQARAIGLYLGVNNKYLGEYKDEIQDRIKTENILDIVDEYSEKNPQAKLVVGENSWNTVRFKYFEYSQAYYDDNDNKVYSPFDCPEFYEYVNWIHQLESEGKLISSEEALLSEDSFDMYLFIVDSKEWNDKDISYIELPFTVDNISNGTGIASNSDKKEKVIELLTLLLTDSELANVLILGQEGRDYYTDGTYAYKMDGTMPYNWPGKLVTGLYDNVYKSDGDWLEAGTLVAKKDLFESDLYIKNPLTGFVPEELDDRVDYNEITILVDFCLDPQMDSFENSYGETKFKKSDFSSTEEWLKEAEKYYKSYGGDLWVEELNRQITEWRNSK